MNDRARYYLNQDLSFGRNDRPDLEGPGLIGRLIESTARFFTCLIYGFSIGGMLALYSAGGLYLLSRMDFPLPYEIKVIIAETEQGIIDAFRRTPSPEENITQLTKK